MNIKFKVGESLDEEDKDKPTKIINGDSDKYGIGKAVTSICQLLFYIILALWCNGSSGQVLVSIFGQ